MENNVYSPIASVIIPTYNRATLLNYTLNSLVNQSLNKNDFEVLVIDDGSSDNSADIAKKYQKKLNVRYFFQEDKGYRVALARNVGIRHAQSDICVFIDSGMLLGSRCIETHIKTHQNHASSIAVIGSVYGLYAKDETDLMSKIDLAEPDKSIMRFKEEKKYLDSRETFYRQVNDKISKLPIPWIVFWTGNVSVDKPSLLAIGMFDENFNTWGSEDLELGCRLHKKKVAFVINRDAAGIHYPHSKIHKKIQTDTENKKYIHEKHKSPMTKLLLTFPWPQQDENGIEPKQV